MIKRDDVVLNYLIEEQEVEHHKLIANIKEEVDRLQEHDIYLPIDFKHRGGKIYSEVINEILWYLLSAGIITQEGNERIYRVTEWGNKIANYLLSSYNREIEKKEVN